jgi:thiamine kinase-like enzyme
MQPSYQYFPLKNDVSKKTYACLQQKPVAFLRYISRYGTPLLSRVGKSHTTFARIKAFLNLALIFAYNRYFEKDTTKFIDLPVYGHLCLKIRRGHKIFDLERRVVVKIFRKDISSNIVQQEITQAARLGQYKFAPAFLRGNAKDGWYEEEFVNGDHPDRSSWKSFLKTFHEVLLPLIEQMTLTSQPQEVMAGDYIRDIHERFIRQKLNGSVKELDSGKVSLTQGFMDSIMRELHARENHPIYLTLTHGDFGPRHVLIQQDRRVILDWEGAGIRSASYDLFDTFFERLWNKPFIPEVSSEVNKAIVRFQKRLIELPNVDFSAMAASFSHVRTYRFVFYFERVSSYLQSEEKLSNQYLDKIVSLIRTFVQYENSSCTNASHEESFQSSLLDYGYQDTIPTILSRPV